MIGVLALASGWSTAHACAVCGAGSANQGAYLDMTIFLSLLPLGILGSFAVVIFLLYRSASEPTSGHAEGDARDA